LIDGHPYQTRKYFSNAVPTPTMASSLGHFVAAYTNSNAIWEVYGPAAAWAEQALVHMVADAIGMDAEKAGGYATWGGQGCTYHGLRHALARTFPGVLKKGVPQNAYMFASELSHFSAIKAAEGSGMGTDKLIVVKLRGQAAMDRGESDESDESITDRLAMDVRDLKEKMVDVIVNRKGVPCFVIATTGTTDNFAIDDVQAISAVIDEVVREHKLEKRPFIHADAAMGGFYSFFRGLDTLPKLQAWCENNKLDKAVADALLPIVKKMQHFHLADSVCIDFHKFGFCPYTSSLFLLKDKTEFNLVDIQSDQSPYIGHRDYAENSYHTSYTMECSRPGSAIPMYMSCLSLGIEGYRLLLANFVAINRRFRKMLLAKNMAVVLNDDCPGHVTLFRAYPVPPVSPQSPAGKTPATIAAADLATMKNVTPSQLWALERSGKAAATFIHEVNKFNNTLTNVFAKDRMSVMIGDTKRHCNVPVYDSAAKSGTNRLPVLAIKFFTISPHTTPEQMDEFVAYVETKIAEAMKEHQKIDLNKLQIAKSA
jgi:glutamate/tyrosine decarboxylase-like PLP-dependent enzyme